jgi:hypothetical protein
MTPESGTKIETKQWVLANIELKINHGRGLKRLRETLRRGKRIFEIRRNRHGRYCMVGTKYYSLKFPFVHYRLHCSSICFCEINELLEQIKATAP